MGFLDRALKAVQPTAPPARQPPQRAAQVQAPIPNPARSTFFQWPTLSGGAEYFNIVGEGNYQAAIDAAAGGKTPDGPVNRWVTAQLVAEPTNPYDRNAVMVALDGQRVGYIPRDQTSHFHRAIAQLGREGRPALCRAVITGGWRRSPTDHGHYGVKLDVEEIPTPLYAGSPFFPCGGSVAITDRKKHQDRWAHHVRPGGAITQIVVALDSPDGDGRLTVTLDGQLIGRLTPSMTERYLPWVHGARSAGLPTTCGAVAWAKDGQPEIALDLRKP